jgi:hypothetical protein
MLGNYLPKINMQFKKHGNQLVFSQVYGITWLLGFFFIAIASALLFATFFANNLEELEIWQLYLARFAGLSIIFIGFYLIYTHPKYKVLLNRSNNQIDLKIFGLFRNESTSYAFPEVNNFSLDTLKDNEDYIYYEIRMNLANGKSVKITKSFHKIKSECDSIIENLNEQINK